MWLYRAVTFYRQCKLEKNKTVQVAWVPEEFARIGQVLQIKENNQWENGWAVAEVWTRKSETFVLGHERDHRTAFPSIPVMATA